MGFRHCNAPSCKPLVKLVCDMIFSTPGAPHCQILFAVGQCILPPIHMLTASFSVCVGRLRASLLVCAIYHNGTLQTEISARLCGGVAVSFDFVAIAGASMYDSTRGRAIFEVPLRVFPTC